jgi:collagenase-like PrtC family protease
VKEDKIMEIGFHLPDFNNVQVHATLMKEMEVHPEYFRDNIKIKSVFGTFPTSVWNGGRYSQGQTTESQIKSVLKFYNDLGIAVRFTFTNPLLREEHLYDPFCNRVLELADNGLNEVIVFSPLLEEYIRKNYPNYKITSSTCKEIRDMDELNAEIEKDYNLVVLDYNWNNKYDELKKIKQPEKCEILINAVCIPECPRRGEHYAQIGREQINYWEYMKNPIRGKAYDYENFFCPHMSVYLYDRLEYPTVILPDDLYTKYIDIGFRQFKIEGRGNLHVSTLEDYVFYLVKPEFREKARVNMLYSFFANQR